MSKERLGKFEKWIVTHSYLKAKGELPANWKVPRGYADTYEPRDVLWKPEILLNYFGHLRLSKRTPGKTILEKFEDTKAYRNALTMFNRAVKRLERKKFIQVWIEKRKRTLAAVSLEKEGMTKAENILSASGQ